VAVPATCTSNGRRKSRHRGLKFLRQPDCLSAPAKENGEDCTSERGIFSPELHLKAPTPPVKQD
jgi:hypothetical protein